MYTVRPRDHLFEVLTPEGNPIGQPQETEALALERAAILNVLSTAPPPVPNAGDVVWEPRPEPVPSSPTHEDEIWSPPAIDQPAPPPATDPELWEPVPEYVPPAPDPDDLLPEQRLGIANPPPGALTVMLENPPSMLISAINPPQSAQGTLITIPLWQPNYFYSQNVVALNSNYLYECNADHTSASTFGADSSFWTPLIASTGAGYASPGADGTVGGTGGTTVNPRVAGASAVLMPSGGDDSAAMVTALTSFAPFASPKVVLGPGTFLWNVSVPGFLRSQAAQVIGAGRDRTIIKLSSAAPRAFDFTKVADGDTFSNIELSDFSVDCNNTTGQHHVVIGNYVSGGITNRINFSGIRISRIRTFNVPSASSTGNYNTGVLHRLNIHITANDTVASGTQHTITDIIIRDVRMEGGNEGAFVGGGGISVDGLNTYMDRVYIYDCWHSTMAQPTQFFACANFQLGSRAFGDHCGIFNCYGFGSGDVGIEVDSLNDISVQGCTMVDSWNNPFYMTNFHTPSNGVAQQRVSWTNCTSIFTTGQNASNTGQGWRVTEQLSIPIGSLHIEDCQALDFQGNNGGINGRAIALIPAQVSRILIRGFRAMSSGLVWNSASNATFNSIYVSVANNSLPEVELTIRDVEISMNYTQSSTGVVNYDGILLAGGTTSGGGIRFVIDDVRITMGGSGISNNSLRGVEVNQGQNVGGTISRLKFVSVTGDAQPRGILVRAQSQPLILTRLNIQNCDFSALPSGGAEILWTDAPNKALTHTRDNIWKTQPIPTTLTGLVTATGKAVGTGWDALAFFTQGSGAAITAIDVSTDNGGHYTNVLTQASGALPAGFDQSIGPLPSDALIKVTFTTTQPTINLVPVNP